MAQTFRAGVIGCGAIAQALHLPGYRRRKDVVRLVGCDPDATNLAEAKTKFKLDATYDDYRRMLADEALDLVSVCTPNCFHAEQAIAALEAGAALLLEKPVATNVADAERIAEAVARTGRRCMVGFSHRLYESNRRMHAVIREGRIGKPFMIRIRFAHRGPQPGWAKSDWFYRPQLAGGGAMLDMGIHAMDLARLLIGEVRSVAAQVATLRKPIEVDDNAVLGLAFDDALGYIEVGWTSMPGFTGVEVYGDEGTLINDYSQPLRLGSGTASPDAREKSAFTWQTLCEPRGGSWNIEMDHFVDGVIEGEPFGMDIADGVAAVRIACAAYESARTGRRIELKGD